MIKTLHLTVSLFLSYLIYYFLFYFDKFSSLILSIITAKISTIPDFDYKISNFCEREIELLEKSKLKYFLFPYYIFLKLLLKIFKHRGFTHSIYPIIMFFILKMFFGNIFLIFIISFLLHILEDSLTVSGIEPFYPFVKFKISFPLLNNKDKNIQKFLSLIFLIIFILVFLLS